MIEMLERENHLELSVIDNGIGMKAEETDRLEELLAGEEPGIKNEYNWQSIGLKNVHDRIRYLYGEDYGIRVTSTAGVGTIVMVLLPHPDTMQYSFSEKSVPEIYAGTGREKEGTDA